MKKTMKHDINTSTLALAACASALSLVACGGGDFVAYIRGTASGLNEGQSVVLQNNGGDNLTVSNNGTFGFGKRLVVGQDYRVTVLTQPAGQFCQVNNGSGSVNSNSDDVTSVTVTCR